MEWKTRLCCRAAWRNARYSKRAKFSWQNGECIWRVAFRIRGSSLELRVRDRILKPSIAERLKSQWERNRKACAWLSLLVFVPIALVISIRYGTDTRFSLLMQDTLAIGGLPPYAGMLSQLGLMAWAASLGMLMLALSSIGSRPSDDGERGLLKGLAIFTMVWLFDDAFMLHESVFPDWGAPELLVYGIYLSGFCVFLVICCRRILDTDFMFFGLSLACFACSLLFDVTNWPGKGHYLLEDGSKFMGIASWTTYCWSVSRNYMRS